MAVQGIWSGTISFSLVAIPVQLVKAVEPGHVSFRMLHRKDYSPLQRRMFCPEEDKEVPPEEIIRGYEIGPDKYLLITDQELEAVSPERSRTIEIVEFIDSKGTIEKSPFLKPEHLPVFDCAFKAAKGTRSIHHMGHLRMMGAEGVRLATERAILAANYVAARLAPYFPVLYSGRGGRVAHECILDLRSFKLRYGVNAEDVAKRLMDYGFHAPTLSFPVPDTLMVEPTESESLAELVRFCAAMIAIHGELEKIASGAWDRERNPLRNAPHTAEELAGDWPHPYSRAEAAYPVPGLRGAKYWPPVKRVDAVHGDRHFSPTLPLE